MNTPPSQLTQLEKRYRLRIQSNWDGGGCPEHELIKRARELVKVTETPLKGLERACEKDIILTLNAQRDEMVLQLSDINQAFARKQKSLELLNKQKRQDSNKNESNYINADISSIVGGAASRKGHLAEQLSDKMGSMIIANEKFIKEQEKEIKEIEEAIILKQTPETQKMAKLEEKINDMNLKLEEEKNQLEELKRDQKLKEIKSPLGGGGREMAMKRKFLFSQESEDLENKEKASNRFRISRYNEGKEKKNKFDSEISQSEIVRIKTDTQNGTSEDSSGPNFLSYQTPNGRKNSLNLEDENNLRDTSGMSKEDHEKLLLEDSKQNLAKAENLKFKLQQRSIKIDGEMIQKQAELAELEEQISEINQKQGIEEKSQKKNGNNNGLLIDEKDQNKKIKDKKERQQQLLKQLDANKNLTQLNVKRYNEVLGYLQTKKQQKDVFINQFNQALTNAQQHLFKLCELAFGVDKDKFSIIFPKEALAFEEYLQEQERIKKQQEEEEKQRYQEEQFIKIEELPPVPVKPFSYWNANRESQELYHHSPNKRSKSSMGAFVPTNQNEKMNGDGEDDDEKKENNIPTDEQNKFNKERNNQLLESLKRNNNNLINHFYNNFNPKQTNQNTIITTPTRILTDNQNTSNSQNQDFSMPKSNSKEKLPNLILPSSGLRRRLSHSKDQPLNKSGYKSQMVTPEQESKNALEEQANLLQQLQYQLNEQARETQLLNKTFEKQSQQQQEKLKNYLHPNSLYQNNQLQPIKLLLPRNRLQPLSLSVNQAENLQTQFPFDQTQNSLDSRFTRPSKIPSSLDSQQSTNAVRQSFKQQQVEDPDDESHSNLSPPKRTLRRRTLLLSSQDNYGFCAIDASSQVSMKAVDSKMIPEVDQKNENSSQMFQPHDKSKLEIGPGNPGNRSSFSTIVWEATGKRHSNPNSERQIKQQNSRSRSVGRRDEMSETSMSKYMERVLNEQALSYHPKGKKGSDVNQSYGIISGRSSRTEPAVQNISIHTARSERRNSAGENELNLSIISQPTKKTATLENSISNRSLKTKQLSPFIQDKYSGIKQPNKQKNLEAQYASFNPNNRGLKRKNNQSETDSMHQVNSPIQNRTPSPKDKEEEEKKAKEEEEKRAAYIEEQNQRDLQLREERLQKEQIKWQLEEEKVEKERLMALLKKEEQEKEILLRQIEAQKLAQLQKQKEPWERNPQKKQKEKGGISTDDEKGRRSNRGKVTWKDAPKREEVFEDDPNLKYICIKREEFPEQTTQAYKSNGSPKSSLKRKNYQQDQDKNYSTQQVEQFGTHKRVSKERSISPIEEDINEIKRSQIKNSSGEGKEEDKKKKKQNEQTTNLNNENEQNPQFLRGRKKYESSKQDNQQQNNFVNFVDTKQELSSISKITDPLMNSQKIQKDNIIKSPQKNKIERTVNFQGV